MPAPTPRPVLAVSADSSSPFVVTGDLTFEGITHETALANEAVFVAAVADLCGVDASAVSLEISEARRRRSLQDHGPTTAARAVDAAPGFVGGGRRLGECGGGHIILSPGKWTDCGDAGIMDNCEDAACNALCEGDGECDTDNDLDNCGSGYDIYKKTCNDCSGAPEPAYVGDGECDSVNNVSPCWDGGDCCAQTCECYADWCGGCEDAGGSNCMDPAHGGAVVVTYAVSVASQAAADAVVTAIGGSSASDVDAAVQAAAQDAGALDDFAGVETTAVGAPAVVAPDGGGSGGSSGGSGGSAIAAAGGGLAAVVVLLLGCCGGVFFYRRGQGSAANKKRMARGGGDEIGLELDDVESPRTVTAVPVEPAVAAYVPGAAACAEATLVFADATVADFDGAARKALVAALARRAGVAPERVEITGYRAGSLVVDCRITFDDEAHAQDFAEEIAAAPPTDLEPELGACEVVEAVAAPAARSPPRKKRFRPSAAPQRAAAPLGAQKDTAKVVKYGLRSAELLLSVGANSGLPLVGQLCAVAKDVLGSAGEFGDKADDVLVAARRVGEVLDMIQLMAKNVDQLDDDDREVVEFHMQKLVRTLGAFDEAVRAFGRQGWRRRGVRGAFGAAPPRGATRTTRAGSSAPGRCAPTSNRWAGSTRRSCRSSRAC